MHVEIIHHHHEIGKLYLFLKVNTLNSKLIYVLIHSKMTDSVEGNVFGAIFAGSVDSSRHYNSSVSFFENLITKQIILILISF